MDCATIVKRGYLYDKKMGLLPVTTVSERERGRVRERERRGAVEHSASLLVQESLPIICHSKYPRDSKPVQITPKRTAHTSY